MEIRGIGIINVAAMFGVKSIRNATRRIDLIVTLKPWDEVTDVDRLGMEQEFVKVLGVDIPHIIIPVRPGRDLARLDRSRRVSDQVEKVRPQRRAGIERPPDRPHEPGQSAAAQNKFPWRFISDMI